MYITNFVEIAPSAPITTVITEVYHAESFKSNSKILVLLYLLDLLGFNVVVCWDRNNYELHLLLLLLDYVIIIIVVVVN